MAMLWGSDEFDGLQAAGQLDAVSDEFYTPEAIRAHLPRVDLDPCAAPSQLLAADQRFIGAHGQDGLALSWDGPRRPRSVRVAFVNPPYNRRSDGQSNLALWTERCRRAAETGEVDVAIALIPARTSESYWRRNIFGVAEAIGFVHGRVRFENAAGIPLADGGKFASAMVIWTYTDRQRPSRIRMAVATAREFAARTKDLVWWVDGSNQWWGTGEPEQ